MPTIFQISTYLTYWLDAVDEHSLHSPFFYDLYTKVIDMPYTGNAIAEDRRKSLLENNTSISVKDFGVGSMTLKSNVRRISDIARTSLTPANLSALYTRLIAYSASTTVLELGTSLGINTLYLALPGTRVTTFEGSPEISAQARTGFEAAGATNINLVQGNIDQTLPSWLAHSSEKIDFVFIDANHRYEPTMRYFQWLLPRVHAQSVFVFDDIHYSKEMQQAWQELRQHTLVYASADLYRCGLIFFDPSLNKQHVVLQR